ncbi:MULTISPECIES: hypothetical protein [Paenibacillus]|uniref:hypothetical protein n=1 Tax=Paenibacillus TaxID=44249 RepID=UPI0022B86724|nr:hypothetical protein [Paenibacillus caseinilyticus]MCZ8518848.1 hypothetical protein [Paenibacillus caseinilyticus]
MKSNLYDELKTAGTADEGERLKKLMAHLRALLEAKKKRTPLERLRSMHPKTEPKAWERRTRPPGDLPEEARKWTGGCSRLEG